jgi:TatD DNase family protein
MHFTDSHCHLDFPEFSNELIQLLKQCEKHAIKRIIIPAVEPKQWQSLLELTKTYSNAHCQLFACAGIHPWYLQGLTTKHLDDLSCFINQSQQELIALGETGIDGVIAKEQNNLSQQQDFFVRHIELAKQFHKPLIIHHRRSHQDIIPLLKQHKVEYGGIIHAFSGSYQQAMTYIDMGLKLGIGGTITYPRAEKTIKAIKRLPLSALVLETDAPAMPLYGEQGKSNSPLNLIKVFDHLCAIRAESPEEISEVIEGSINELFFSNSITLSTKTI